MQLHHSIGTTALVALMAAHRMVKERPLPGRLAPLEPDAIRRITDRLWEAEAAPRDESSAAAPA
jgi:hypothetical protein